MPGKGLRLCANAGFGGADRVHPAAGRTTRRWAGIWIYVRPLEDVLRERGKLAVDRIGDNPRPLIAPKRRH